MNNPIIPIYTVHTRSPMRRHNYPTTTIPLLMLPKPLNPMLDPPVDVLRHLLQRQTVVNPLHGTLDTRLDSLSDALRGRGEVGYVALPARRPPCRLVCETFLCAGQHEVEGCEASEARKPEGRDFC